MRSLSLSHSVNWKLAWRTGYRLEVREEKQPIRQTGFVPSTLCYYGRGSSSYPSNISSRVVAKGWLLQWYTPVCFGRHVVTASHGASALSFHFLASKSPHWLTAWPWNPGSTDFCAVMLMDEGDSPLVLMLPTLINKPEAQSGETIGAVIMALPWRLAGHRCESMHGPQHM